MKGIQTFLQQIEKDYQRAQLLSSDPVEFVHHYSDPWNQEAVALLSAVLAYGQVRQIRKSIEDALGRISQMEESPRRFVSRLHEPDYLKKTLQLFDSWVHRFNTGPDVIRLFQLLNLSWKKYGSLGGHFLTHLEPHHATIEIALNRLIQDWKSVPSDFKVPESFHYLLTAPQDGSCCKRWCMLLRWMGRRDEVDPGLWTLDSPLQATFPMGRTLSASQLIMPLDTHTGRISQSLGLTRRKSLNWKAALDVTESFRAIDPLDPVRYDFALSRLGMLQDPRLEGVLK